MNVPTWVKWMWIVASLYLVGAGVAQSEWPVVVVGAIALAPVLFLEFRKGYQASEEADVVEEAAR